MCVCVCFIDFSYNEEIMAQTIRWAMTENIKSPAKGTSISIFISISISASVSLLQLLIVMHKFIFICPFIYSFIFFFMPHNIANFY